MNKRVGIALVIGIAVGIGLGTGIIIGLFAIPKDSDCSQETTDYYEDNSISKLLINSVNVEKLRDNLRAIAGKPHLAGTDREKENAEYVKEKWIESGLESVHMVPYDVLLSYPNKTSPNKIRIIDQDDIMIKEIVPGENKLNGTVDGLEELVQPFNAFCQPDTVEGDVVYVNYAREEDFEHLKSRGIDVVGKILLARYSHGFRGYKAFRAFEEGGSGLILYSDPADYGPPPGETDRVYPDGWWMPGDGVQRGHLNTYDARGDPLTPGYPSTASAFRLNISDAPDLPRIPVQPIGYDDALEILRNLGGDEVEDEDWIGGLDVTYRYGGIFNSLSNASKVILEVNNYFERREVNQVIGYIRGAIEPDRYVIVGNHRDAWTYGAVDASGGTASLIELARAFGSMVKDHGWRPRRTLVFCSWEGHEFNQIGATEWVEEFNKILSSRTVAYLNVDIGVSGNHYPRIKATPALYTVIYEASKKVPTPVKVATGDYLYDFWLENRPNGDATLPRFSNLDSADYRAFFMRYGISSADFRIRYDPDEASSFPTYHSAYETVYLIENYIDPDFSCHRALTQLWAETARDLADSQVLPINSSDYAVVLKQEIESLRQEHETRMNAHGITFDYLISSLDNFTKAAEEMQARALSVASDLKIRALNDQLMYLERAFVDPLGIPGRKFTRHMVYAPSDSYYNSPAVFPGVVHALHRLDDPKSNGTWPAVEEQLAILTFTLQSAANTLSEFVPIMN